MDYNIIPILVLCPFLSISMATALGIWQPTDTTKLDKCALDDIKKQHSKQDCWLDCLKDPCCRALKIDTGCDKAYVQDQTMDFVLQVGPLKVFFC